MFKTFLRNGSAEQNKTESQSNLHNTQLGDVRRSIGGQWALAPELLHFVDIAQHCYSTHQDVTSFRAQLVHGNFHWDRRYRQDDLATRRGRIGLEMSGPIQF